MFTPEQIEKSFKLTDLFGKKGWNVAKSEFSGLGEESDMNRRARVCRAFCPLGILERKWRKKGFGEKKRGNKKRRRKATKIKGNKTTVTTVRQKCTNISHTHRYVRTRENIVSRTDAGSGSTVAVML